MILGGITNEFYNMLYKQTQIAKQYTIIIYLFPRTAATIIK